MHLHQLRLIRIVADSSLTADIAGVLAASGVRDAVHLAIAARPSDGAEMLLTLTEALASPSDAEAALGALHDGLQARHAIIAYAVDAHAFLREQRL